MHQVLRALAVAVPCLDVCVCRPDLDRGLEFSRSAILQLFGAENELSGQMHLYFVE